MTLEKAIPNFDKISEEFERAFGAQAVDGLEHDAEDPMDVTDLWNEHRIRSGLKVGPRRNGSPVPTMTASGGGTIRKSNRHPQQVETRRDRRHHRRICGEVSQHEQRDCIKPGSRNAYDRQYAERRRFSG